MAMSRKHYREFAESFKGALAYTIPGTEAAKAVARTARMIADDCKRDNSAFRYDTFFAACGLDYSGYDTVRETEEDRANERAMDKEEARYQ